MNDNDLRLINSKKPYSDVRLPQTGIDFLWDIINHSPTKTEYKINNEDMSGLADFKNEVLEILKPKKKKVLEILKTDEENGFEKVDDEVLNDWVNNTENVFKDGEGNLKVSSEKLNDLLLGVLGEEKFNLIDKLKSAKFSSLFQLENWTYAYEIVFKNTDNVAISTIEELNTRITLIKSSVLIMMVELRLKALILITLKN